MPRRGHKKSRAGCAECKRRHVKCDETHPSCVNCKVASLKCSYTKSAQASLSTPRSSGETPNYSPLTLSPAAPVIVRQDAIPSFAPQENSINLDHLELLHHYENMTYHSFVTDDGSAKRYKDTAIANALRYPFLMYAILALAAMHICRIRPERSDYYRSLASSLQAVGLNGFKDTLLDITTENCVAVFIFTSTTGLHSFCDAFTVLDTNFNNFLDKVTNAIQLMRGVRSVMEGGWWDHLRTSSVAEIIAAGRVLGDPGSGMDKNKETKPLWELLTEADLGPASYKVYEEAVEQLQRIFDADARLASSETSISMVFAWPVILSSEYNDLLKQRRPEALVILAFYGVILFKRRGSWAVDNSGQFLIQGICDYLGKHWDRWLQWPKAFISSSPMTTTSNTPI